MRYLLVFEKSPHNSCPHKSKMWASHALGLFFTCIWSVTITLTPKSNHLLLTSKATGSVKIDAIQVKQIQYFVYVPLPAVNNIFNWITSISVSTFLLWSCLLKRHSILIYILHFTTFFSVILPMFFLSYSFHKSLSPLNPSLCAPLLSA